MHCFARVIAMGVKISSIRSARFRGADSIRMDNRQMTEGKNTVEGYAWIVFAIVLSTQIIALGFGMVCIPPFLTTIATELKLSSTQVGLAWGMIGLGALIFSIIGGLISDRIGLRWAGFWGLLFMSLSGAMRGFARDYLSFIVAMFLFGAAVGLTRLNFPRALSQWFPSKRLGMVNGISGSGAAFGAAVSMGVSASILGPLVGGWRNIVILLGGFTFLLAVLWILLIREKIADRHSVAGMTVVFKGLAYVLRSKTIWVLSFISLLLFGHAQSWTSHMPGFFETGYAMTNAAAARLVSLSLFGAVFASIIGPTISDRIGLRRRVMLVACVIGGVTNILQGSFLGPVLIIILLVMPFGVGSISPLLFTVPFELRGLRPAIAGSAVGMIFAFQNLGAFIYPILSGKLIDLFGPNYYPYFFAQALVFAVIFMLVLRWLPETGSRASVFERGQEN